MCYCGNTLAFEACCGPLISGQQQAKTPEQLMRSRYSAYTIKEIQYLYHTYATEQQAANSLQDIAHFAAQCQFIKLDIIHSSSKGERGVVEFKAYYFCDDQFWVLHERSSFVRQQSHWRYHSGELFDIPPLTPGRNTPCPCGSGKKYKRCHAQ